MGFSKTFLKSYLNSKKVVYIILQIDLLDSKTFWDTGAPAFQNFNQSKCSVRQHSIVIGQKFGKPVALQST